MTTPLPSLQITIQKNVFDETGQKRKKFVELFKKHRDLTIRSAIDVFKDDNGDINTDIVKLFLENQMAPAKLWDAAGSDTVRQKIFDALVQSLSEKQSSLYQEIEDLENLKDELLSISDEEELIDDEGEVVEDDGLKLYHATPRSNLASIEGNGLSTMNRRHVYLYEDEMDAIRVAERHGDSDIVVLSVDKEELEANWMTVEQKDFGRGLQWCVEGNIPAEYIIFP